MRDKADRAAWRQAGLFRAVIGSGRRRLPREHAAQRFRHALSRFEIFRALPAPFVLAEPGRRRRRPENASSSAEATWQEGGGRCNGEERGKLHRPCAHRKGDMESVSEA